MKVVFASASPEAKRHAPPLIQSVFFHVVILATGLCGLSVCLCVCVREREDCYFLSSDRNTEQKLRARRSGSILEVSPF